jgi:hypothetical protein
MRKENILTQMGYQRDDLLDKYAKSKKLALALGRDNHLQAKGKVMNHLANNADYKRKDYYEFSLNKNIEMIGKLKDSIRHFEVGNEITAVENEDLRKFSLDGYNMAKSA